MKQQYNKHLRTGFMSLMAIAFCAGLSHAQSFPTKPITYIVGFGAGAGIDAVARIVAQRVAEG